MKKILLLLLGILPLFAHAQTNKVLSLLNAKNTPVSKSFQPIGFLDADKVKLDVIRITDLNTDSVYSGLKFEVARKGQLISNILDKKETGILIKLIAKFKEQSEIEQAYLDLTLTSNFQIKRSNENLFKSWLYTILINKFKPDTDYNFGQNGLNELLNKLSIASALMLDTN